MSLGNALSSPVRRFAMRAVWSGLMVTLATGLSGCGPECDELLGPCPPPEPGVLLNDANISHSVWFEDVRIGAPDKFELTRSLCQADLDKRPGDELAFRGDDGLTVLAAEAGSPSTIAFIPVGVKWHMAFLDVDGDGDSEFLSDWNEPPPYELTLWDHAGNLQWSQANTGPGDWEHADVDGDGIEEFAFAPFQGVNIVKADGTTIANLVAGEVRTIEFGDVDGDGGLEIVAHVIDDSLFIWETDGTEINSFVPSEQSDPSGFSRLRMVRLPNSDRDHILFDCVAYDIDGSVVTRLDTDESWPVYCPVEEVEYGRPAIESDSCARKHFAILEEPIEHEFEVVFVAGQPSFRVHLSYSIIAKPGFVYLYEATRTILRIFNPEGTLVYHEVLESASTPGSAAVIPSDVENQEILLLADDSRILAYQLDPDVGSN